MKNIHSAVLVLFAAFGASALAAGPRMRALYTVPHELDMLLKYGHIQGATCSEKALYLSHQGGILKIDWATGALVKAVEAPMHLGDVAYAKGRLYGAFGVREYGPGETPCQVGMWDEELNLLKKRSVRHLRTDGQSLARGFDGAVVVGDVFYTCLDHTGKGVWDCPPHRDLPVAAFSLDLEPKGVKVFDLGYAVLYGVQTMATDGTHLFFGNYGAPADKGNPSRFNFTVATTDGRVVHNGAFGCSEGFGLVPKSVSKRDAPVYFTVNALGGNMQGWRKDPTNNPPRIRIDFYEYDAATGRMADVTDRADPLEAKPMIQKVFTYDKPDATPIVFSAESKADNACAQDYCLWLDVEYVDGSATWGTRDANEPCRTGTHGWERTVGVFTPDKPVKKIVFSALFRHAVSGTALFRDLRLERRAARPGERTKIEPTDFPRTRGPKDAARGPTTVPPDGFTVWTADSMARVTPCTYPPADAPAPAVSLELMRRERESAQICVTCGKNREIAGATVTLSPLVNAQGARLAWKWERVGYVPRMKGYGRHVLGAPREEKWLADPLLPAAPFRVRAGATQGAWLTVHAPADAAPGAYAGTATVAADGRSVAVPVRVTVSARTLPKTFSTWNSFSIMDGFTRKLYPNDFKAKKRESWDVMLDHRLSPDDISRFTPPDVDDLLYARERGMNLFNILNIVPVPKDPNTPIVYTTTSDVLFSDWFYPSFRDRIVPYVAKLRAHGLDKMAYIYGFDEQEKEFYPAIDLFWKNLRRDVPGIPLMSTSRAYRDLADGVKDLPPSARAGDWMCPLTANWNEKLTRELRAEGKKVWWYTCCGPGYPFANFVTCEFPPIEGRLLGWMTQLYRADGFLFWVVNFWARANNVPLDEGDTYLDWDSRCGEGAYGDGVLIYPGKEHLLPSIRLANVRDGVEDGELVKMAQNEDAAKTDALCRKLVRTLTDFTRSPQELRAVRAQLLGLAPQ